MTAPLCTPTRTDVLGAGSSATANTMPSRGSMRRRTRLEPGAHTATVVSTEPVTIREAFTARALTVSVWTSISPNLLSAVWPEGLRETPRSATTRWSPTNTWPPNTTSDATAPRSTVDASGARLRWRTGGYE
eukprot:Amastigsp_a680245_2.p3 type:complete len:132 gc:universal Amastigsp_a680245_2:351-746(+)